MVCLLAPLLLQSLRHSDIADAVRDAPGHDITGPGGGWQWLDTAGRQERQIRDLACTWWGGCSVPLIQFVGLSAGFSCFLGSWSITLRRQRIAKTFLLVLCLTLTGVPLVGCGGVESEPVGTPMTDDGDAGLEGVDTSLEGG